MSINVLFGMVVVTLCFCALAAMWHPAPKPTPVTFDQILHAMKHQGFNIVSSPFREDYPARLLVPTLEVTLHLKTPTEGRMLQRGYRWQPVPSDVYGEIVATYEAFVSNIWS